MYRNSSSTWPASGQCAHPGPVEQAWVFAFGAFAISKNCIRFKVSVSMYILTQSSAFDRAQASPELSPGQSSAQPEPPGCRQVANRLPRCTDV